MAKRTSNKEEGRQKGSKEKAKESLASDIFSLRAYQRVKGEVYTERLVQ